MKRDDVVVTGIGAVAPNGLGVDDYWKATLDGTTAIAPITHFDSSAYSARLAGRISNFQAREHLPPRLLPQTDRVTRLALVAADWAIKDAAVSVADMDDFRCGVVTSNAFGGFEYSHREMQKLWTEGPEAVSVYQCFAWFYAVNTGQISIRNGMRGPGGVVVAEQAGGLDAIGQARRQLHSGRSQVMLTGGVESAFDPWGWVSYLASGQVSEATDPTRAYLPFDVDAAGFVPGEGGAILTLETAAHALERGAHKPYGRITGYAATFDPAPGTGRPSGLRRAIETALVDSELEPHQIDLVLADAAGTPELDVAEAETLSVVFGARGVPVSAPKAAVGRLMAGGGPLDVTCALMAIRDGVAPPTPNVRSLADTCDIDLVLGAPRPADIGAVLVIARGAGGFNSAVIVQDVA